MYGESRRAALWAPIAPFALGIYYVQQHGMRIVGLLGLVIAVCLVGLTILSTAKTRRWIVLINHLFILLYWVYGFLLLGAAID